MMKTQQPSDKAAPDLTPDQGLELAGLQLRVSGAVFSHNPSFDFNGMVEREQNRYMLRSHATAAHYAALWRTNFQVALAAVRHLLEANRGLDRSQSGIANQNSQINTSLAKALSEIERRSKGLNDEGREKGRQTTQNKAAESEILLKRHYVGILRNPIYRGKGMTSAVVRELRKRMENSDKLDPMSLPNDLYTDKTLKKKLPKFKAECVRYAERHGVSTFPLRELPPVQSIP